MSIYLAKKELRSILDRSKLKYTMELNLDRHVAVDKNGKYLSYEDYSEEDLQKLVETRKNIFVDLEFWNYNYCSSDNLDPRVSEEFIDNLTVIVRSFKEFSIGTLVILIIVHEILLNTFKIKSKDLYLEYLSDIKISKKIIRNFMLRMDYQFPLTENYLTLILEVFDDETIYDFIFRDCCNFTLGEFEKVMEFFALKDINMASLYVCDRFKDSETRLKYLEKCIILFENKIDITESVTYTKKNKNPYIGYCLLTMKVTPEIHEIYYTVIQRYMDKFGSINITVSDSKEDTKFIKKRKQEILNYFDKF
tara:strand:- start:35904 stop:36824 length:921 start_codon:yes stop_codon:yes gene_type:complete